MYEENKSSEIESSLDKKLELMKRMRELKRKQIEAQENKEEEESSDSYFQYQNHQKTGNEKDANYQSYRYPSER